MANEKVAALLDDLEQGVSACLNDEDFAHFLDAMAMFHTYSWNNAWLIMSQFPNATRVAGFNGWRKIDRFVRKGEKGIRIIVPMKGKKDDDGKRPTFFGVGYVFDISQTEGRDIVLPKAEITDQPTANTINEISALQIWLLNRGVRLEGEPDSNPKTEGYFALPDNRIWIRPDLKELHYLKVLIHEAAHHVQWTLNSKDGKRHQDPDQVVSIDPGMRELTAEGAAYILARQLGYDTGSYSFNYIARYTDPKERIKAVRASLKQIDIIVSIMREAFPSIMPVEELAA